MGGEAATCRTGDPCTMDSDCERGTRCNDQRCTRLFCLPDGSSCDTGEVCESQSCIVSPDGPICWAQGPVAEGWSCLTRACESDLECIANFCRTSGSIEAGDGCETDAQCAEGLICHDLFCDGEYASCEEPLAAGEDCCTNSDCAAPGVCRSAESCSTILSRQCGRLSGPGGFCCGSLECEGGLTCNENTEPSTTPATHRSTSTKRTTSSSRWTPPDAVIAVRGAPVDLRVSIEETDTWNIGTFDGTLTLNAAVDLEIPVRVEVSEP